ncbi:DoxX family protein [Chondrinema litorale]|uniref:DoxX family protein n=1 Tax=Chondrinema litorale TaxID=2994555 RepID=UPI002543BC8C|nr:DoxX family protein [Chondrinema litorale]UZR97880.1 DoxX family protein [Chondrinema litorale]
MKILALILRFVAAAILLQTLFFKFTAAPESVYIFSQLGMEPLGRIGTGIAELVAGILLLTPKTVFYGAVASFAIISGAIVSHLTVLGIVVQNDGGLLFLMAVIVLLSSGTLIYLYKETGVSIIQKLKQSKKTKTTI